MSELGDLVKAAKVAKALVDQTLFKAIVVDSGEARVAAALCLSISEHFSATLCLIEGRHTAQGAIIVRSMLEGLADLLNLVRDPGHLNQMRFENARSDVTLFDDFGFDTSIIGNSKITEKLTEWRAKALPIRDELRSKGYKRQTVVQKFKSAEIQTDYIAYRVFCSFAHNQLTTLIARHAGPAVLRYHDDVPEETVKSILTVSLAILCKAVNVLPNFTDIDALELTSTLNHVDAIWDTSG